MRPIRTKPFPAHPIIGDEEKRAVMEVLDSGRLSTFLAVQGEYFNGGQKVKEFERRFADYHGTKYAVAFNSGTAALHAAVVAVGVKSGEEVIVPPYTFTSTASAVLMHNAIPVFADVDPETFCLDPIAVQQQSFSPLSKAIIAVHLFGGPAEMQELMILARRHHVKVIEDCAQAPGARYQGEPVGTLGDCGIFSFTENKNITTGEGGMLITNDPAIAEAARMVRNHGENILEGQTVRTYAPTILGWNYRMTEMEAALGIVQLGKLDWLNERRIELAEYLTQRLKDIEGLGLPVVHPINKHVYYVYPIRYDEQIIGMPRETFAKALAAEGIPVGVGYIKPLYLTPLYHDKKPFPLDVNPGYALYRKGICPVAERLYEKELLLIPVVRPPATFSDMDDIAEAFHKVLA